MPNRWSELQVNWRHHQEILEALKISLEESPEAKQLANYAEEWGFDVIDIPGDGNCQFSAICDQLHRSLNIRTSQEKLRNLVAKFWRKAENRNGYEIDHYYKNWDDYCAKIKENGNWGDHYSLWALANELKIDICVLSSSRIIHNINAPPLLPTGKIYLGHYCESHYCSLEKSKDISH